MVISHGRVTDPAQRDLFALLREILQQQTAMLQVQAESVRLQRVLVERLLAVSDPQTEDRDTTAVAPAIAIADLASSAPTVSEGSAATVPSTAPSQGETAPNAAIVDNAPEPPPVEAESDLRFAPAPADQNAARGARYYQPRPSPVAKSFAPEELELMRRLQELRGSSDLILQFGPYKGSTLAQVALSNPEYIRQLMRSAQRPEVRAAAGRLVQALDAAAEHKKTRSSARRGRPTR